MQIVKVFANMSGIHTVERQTKDDSKCTMVAHFKNAVEFFYIHKYSPSK